MKIDKMSSGFSDISLHLHRANYFVYKAGRPLTAIRFDGESAYYIGSIYRQHVLPFGDGDDAALGVNSHFSVSVISVVLFTAIFTGILWLAVALANKSRKEGRNDTAA